MNYLSFLNDILPEIQALLPAGETAQYRKIHKNNGVEYTAVCLLCHESGQTSPIVYMEPFFEACKNGTDPRKIAETAALILMNGAPEGMNGARVMDKEFALSHTVFRLVGRDRNLELRDEVVCRDYLDLLLTYGIYLPDRDHGGMTVIRKEMTSNWGVTEEELYARAAENTAVLLGDKIENMNELLSHEPGDSEEKMYVLSNRISFYGASVMLYSEKIGELAEKLNSDLYILPSSVHELILIPAEENQTDFLKNLVQSVNSTELHRENILSDRVYRYCRADGRIIIAG